MSILMADFLGTDARRSMHQVLTRALGSADTSVERVVHVMGTWGMMGAWPWHGRGMDGDRKGTHEIWRFMRGKQGENDGKR